MAIQLRQRWQAVRDRTTFPRINFFIDFLEDLATVLALNAVVRVFLWAGHWLTVTMPVGGAAEPESYLPFDHIRAIVTVLYFVSTGSITVSGTCTLLKIMGLAASELRR